MKLANPHYVAARTVARPAYHARAPLPDFQEGLRDALAEVAETARSLPEYIPPRYKPATAALVQEDPVRLDKPKVVAKPTVSEARLKQAEAFNVHEDHSRNVRTDERPTCKLRPKSNKSRRGRRATSKREFIPWCK